MADERMEVTLTPLPQGPIWNYNTIVEKPPGTSY